VIRLEPYDHPDTCRDALAKLQEMKKGGLTASLLPGRGDPTRTLRPSRHLSGCASQTAWL